MEDAKQHHREAELQVFVKKVMQMIIIVYKALAIAAKSVVLQENALLRVQVAFCKGQNVLKTKMNMIFRMRSNYFVVLQRREINIDAWCCS